jgi:molybdopterin-guanine dinucleotide biosynthesis protein A
VTAPKWNALVLAAGRGPDDPMAKAFGVPNKTLIPIAGTPMLLRVVNSLESSGVARSITICIEDGGLPADLLPKKIATMPAAHSAPSSVLAAVGSKHVDYPVLITTGDHPLLTPEMVRYFCQQAEQSGADFAVGLARAETILEAYPSSIRTFFRLGPDRVSGCNIFALRSPKGLALLEHWQYLEAVRKKPWRLVAAFGLQPLLLFLAGSLSLQRALALISKKLGARIDAVIMPFAEAAIDVDKPADKALAEEILRGRGEA